MKFRKYLKLGALAVFASLLSTTSAFSANKTDKCNLDKDVICFEKGGNKQTAEAFMSAKFKVSQDDRGTYYVRPDIKERVTVQIGRKLLGSVLNRYRSHPHQKRIDENLCEAPVKFQGPKITIEVTKSGQDTKKREWNIGKTLYSAYPSRCGASVRDRARGVLDMALREYRTNPSPEIKVSFQAKSALFRRYDKVRSGTISCTTKVTEVKGRNLEAEVKCTVTAGNSKKLNPATW